MMQTIYYFFLSIQHFLVMYTGAVVIPLILGSALNLTPEEITFLISADLLTSGIATLLYTINTKYIGTGLPVVLGASFNSLAAFITIGKTSGLPTVYGAIIVSGLAIFILAPLVGKLIKQLPPMIPGIVITVIGLSLIPVAFQNIAPSSSAQVQPFSYFHTIIFLSCIMVILILQLFKSAMVRNLSILISIIVFSFIFYLYIPIEAHIVNETPFFNIPHLFYFGWPVFELNAIITFIIILLVTSIESAGDLTALSIICEKDLDEKTLVKSFRSEGIATFIGGIFNAFTYSNFAQNVGLVQMTGTKKVIVVQGTAFILILLSFFPKIAAITTLIPQPVLGASMLTMFGMITASGIRILSSIDFKDNVSIWTLALSIGFGMGVATFKDTNHIFPTFITPIITNPIVMSVLVAITTYYIMSFQIQRKHKKG